MTTGKRETGGPTDWELPKGSEPTPPDVPTKFLPVQFWRDIFGKEVQSAATYSYLWSADQMGHIAVGIILQVTGYFLFTRIAAWVPGMAWIDAWANGLSLLLIAGCVSYWEVKAFRASKADAGSKQFPLDVDLLRRNAVVATVYMVIGAVAGYDINLRTGGEWTWVFNIAIFLAAAVAAVLAAPFWLRQKIVWQKAALPYLARLADLRATIDADAAAGLRALIDGPGIGERPRQVLVIGPIGSGRTPLVCGLGTELAFKDHKVRYCSFDTLMEISSQYGRPRPDGLPPVGTWGPRNIFYWPWFEAQTLIIDDISPIVAAAIERYGRQAFSEILHTGLKEAAGDICKRNTVWVFGADDQDIADTADVRTIDDLIAIFAAAIQEFCNAPEPPLIVRLPRPTVPSA